MIFEYEEKDRVARWQAAEVAARRAAFEAAAEPLEALRRRGAEAHALIVHVDDLQIPYPGRNGVAACFHVDVSTPGAATYRALIPAIVAVGSLPKYSTGRQVFVRVDPHDPQRVAFDSDRNRSLAA